MYHALGEAMDKTEDEERGSESVVRNAGVLFWYVSLQTILQNRISYHMLGLGLKGFDKVRGHGDI